jgi:hypothetical protein
VKATKSAGHTRKHTATKKHHNTKKHTGTSKHRPDAHQLHEEHLHHEHEEHLAHEAVHAVAKPASHAKPRSLALAGTGCCATEALAASLRLAGASVTGADVLALHRLAGADDETGAPIGVLLAAAAEYGLAGFRPAFAPALPQRGYEAAREAACKKSSYEPPELRPGHALILGVELPGPHAVLATPDGWWSWGELWCPCEFPDAMIEEAWAVAWS